ncbi:unnamed protein product, partial [Ectocarpus sp. 6 AP-2014]
SQLDDLRDAHERLRLESASEIRKLRRDAREGARTVEMAASTAGQAEDQVASLQEELEVCERALAQARDKHRREVDGLDKELEKERVRGRAMRAKIRELSALRGGGAAAGPRSYSQQQQQQQQQQARRLSSPFGGGGGTTAGTRRGGGTTSGGYTSSSVNRSRSAGSSRRRRLADSSSTTRRYAAAAAASTPVQHKPVLSSAEPLQGGGLELAPGPKHHPQGHHTFRYLRYYCYCRRWRLGTRTTAPPRRLSPIRLDPTQAG